MTTSSTLISRPLAAVLKRNELALLLGILIPVLVLLAFSSWYFCHRRKKHRQRKLIDAVSDRINISMSGRPDVKPAVEMKPTVYCQTDVENMAKPRYLLTHFKIHDKILEISSPIEVPATLASREVPSSPTLTISLSLIQKVQSPLGGLVARLTGRPLSPSINTINVFNTSTSSLETPFSVHETDSFVEPETPKAALETTAMSLGKVISSTGLMAYTSSNKSDSETQASNIELAFRTDSRILQSCIASEGVEAEVCWTSMGKFNV